MCAFRSVFADEGTLELHHDGDAQIDLTVVCESLEDQSGGAHFIITPFLLINGMSIRFCSLMLSAMNTYFLSCITLFR